MTATASDTRESPSEGYRAVLAWPGVGVTIAASLGARLPVGMIALGIVLLTRAEHASFGTAGALVAAFSIANSLCTPVQGMLMDRLGPRRVIRATVIGQPLALLGLTAALREGAPAGISAVLAAIAGALLPTIAPASRGFYSRLPDDIRDRVYSLDAISQELVWSLGPMLTAVLVSVISALAGLLAAAVVTLAGGAWFLSTPGAAGGPAAETGQVRGRLLTQPELRIIFLTLMLCGIATGTLDVGIPAIASHIGHAGLSGVLLGLTAVGSIAGGLLLGHRSIGGTSPGIRLAILCGLCGLSLIPLAVVPDLAIAFPASFLAGMLWSSLLGGHYAIIGRLAPAGTTAAAFSLASAAIVSGAAAGSAATGWLIDAADVHVAMLLGPAVVFAAVPVAALSRLRGRVAA